MLAQAALRVDWVSYYLYESGAWLVVAGLAVVWMLLRVGGRRTGNARLTRISWVPVGLMIALALTASLVTTKRERLIDTLDALLQSVEDQDFEAFREIVTEDAEALFPPGNAAQSYTRDGVERRLKEATLSDLVLLADDSALVDERDAVSFIRIRTQGDYAGISGVQIYEWSIQWRYESGRWRAYRLTCESIGFGPSSSSQAEGQSP